ncbi:MAG: 6-phosphogluconolactonase [Patescibacteria group bacterium]|nr:6-phosphogluconolactonase [Patescibacteria group bacterium]
MPNKPKKLSIFNYSSREEAEIFAGAAINRLLETGLGRPVLLLLSAGSALKILDGVNPSLFGSRATVTMLDERFSNDPEVNNFARLQHTDFYKEIFERETNLIGTSPRPKETQEQLARRWETGLKNWRQENPSGKIFATIGMGQDGHVAGIMPFSEDPDKFNRLFSSNNWAAAYDAGGKNPYPLRITATMTFLKMLDAAIGIITGPEKKPSFEKMLSKQATLAELPAMVFWDMKNLGIYTDIK